MVISAINIFFSLCAGFIFADEQNPPLPSETNAARQEDTDLSEFQKQARIYRLEGLRLQKLGRIEEALGMFQKAIGTDPSLAAAYNDLGIISESLGSPERAEEAYWEAIRLSPEFVSPYSNLALLYEGQEQMDKAVSCWAKRVELGLADDPWTKKAKDRYDELMSSMPEIKDRQIELETTELMSKISGKKRIEKLEAQKKSQEYIFSAKKLYNQRDYLRALQEIEKSLSLTPENKDAKNLKEELTLLAEKQKSKENIAKIKSAFNAGLKEYQQGNQDIAKKEFEKIIKLVEPPLVKSS